MDRSVLAAIAVERTLMPMLVTDPRQNDNPIVLANRAFLDLTGYRADEIIGRNCRFLQGDATSEASINDIRTAVAEQRELNIEILNYRKDGTSFWNRLHISPIQDNAGKLLYFFASQVDITDFRRVQRLEASERRLLLEVDHRARNVLAIVNGIVRLSRSDDAALYAAAVQHRVQALARAHSLLAERGWQDVTLAEVARGQLSSFGSQRIRLAGPEIMVPAFFVQPLALVIHELGVNAATHGALSRSLGNVALDWHSVGQRGGFELHWEEKGGPAPRAIRPTGFGTVMTDAIIGKQLSGHIYRSWEEEGFRAEIEIPEFPDTAGSQF